MKDLFPSYFKQIEQAGSNKSIPTNRISFCISKQAHSVNTNELFL